MSLPFPPILFEGLLYVAVLAFCVREIVKTRRELRETRAKREAAERDAAARAAEGTPSPGGDGSREGH